MFNVISLFLHLNVLITISAARVRLVLLERMVPLDQW